MQFKKSLFALLLVSFITQLSIAHAAKEKKKPEPEYWKETGLTLDFFEQESLSHCNDTEKTILACLSVLNGLAGSSKPAVQYATAEEKAQNADGLGDLVSTTGYGLNTYSIQSKDYPLKTEWLAGFKKARDLKAKAAASLRASQARIPFASLIRSLTAQLIANDPSLNESYLVGQMMNDYLQVTIDPHTHLTPTAEDTDERNGEVEVFAGVGASISSVNKQFVIADFVEDSPAESSGMKIGDAIIAVDGKSVEGMTTDKMIQLVRGKEGTEAHIRVKRGQQEIDLTMVRKIFKNQNVESKIVNDAGTPYAYIKIRAFMAKDTSDRVKDAIQSLTAQGAKGIILDLRGNPGGDIVQAERVSALFVGRKNTVTLRGLDGTFQARFIGEFDAVTQLPVVTMINGGSASASEIVSGALQDYQRSWVLGDRSYGKGTAQRVTNFDAEGKVKIARTLSRFYEPSDRTNQIVGIVPDFSVDPFPGATAEDKFTLREEDLYSNALPEVGAPWKQTRPAAVTKINTCRVRSGQAEKLFSSRSNTGGKKPDYRLFAAEDVLNCSR